ncbi:MAG: single-stranded-DNA-specific exonuclease RecJ [Tissierellales bacterium]|jgi:single-stranded-DNA-specific exonuclease|nr:single-stranded-DNA-specific exonuclease RecJ [Tissierellales bacterium]
MKTLWRYIDQQSDDILKSLMADRGITKQDDVDEFLSDRPRRTYDPMAIDGMKELVEKIASAIKQNKNLVIAGDYDMDGIGAVSVLIEYLKPIMPQVQYYIPNRYTDGYGLSNGALDYIKNEMNGEIVLTVDNGISCYEQVEYGKSIGLDIIVTDHHNPPEKLPDCLLVDLKLNRDNYPFKELCGCGIAFKICQGLNTIYKIPKRKLLELTDIVALSTIADVVSLTDENRTLVKFGLLQLKSGNRLGIRELCEALDMKVDEIKSGSIGFRLAPCFNASGRMEDARLGVELLVTNDKKRAKELANYLKQLNDERRSVQESGEEKCQELVERKYADDLFLVIREDSVSEGVMGIIAGRLRDKYYRPTLVMTQTEKGVLKASGRSIDGIDLYEEMKSCEDLFIGYGGHANACGLSMEADYIDELRSRLNSKMQKLNMEDKELYNPKIVLAGDVLPKDLDFDFLELLEKMEPFGMGNPTPIFSMTEVKLENSYKKFCGNNEQHLRIQGYKDNLKINGIGFSMSEYYRNIGEPSVVDLAFVPKINEWQGKKNIQLMLKDLRDSNE